MLSEIEYWILSRKAQRLPMGQAKQSSKTNEIASLRSQNLKLFLFDELIILHC